MNAPTGRKARVSVIERSIAASDFPKSLPIAGGRAWCGHPCGVKETSSLHHFPHGCDVAHAAVPALAPRFPVLLRAKPSKDGDAEPWGYGGLTAMLARPPAIRWRPFCFPGGD